MMTGATTSLSLLCRRSLFQRTARWCRLFETSYARRAIHVASSEARIVEVGPRDGLQNEPRAPDTAGKLELVQRLYQAGCRHIEVGSLVSPKWVPSMADTMDVLEGLKSWRQTLPRHEDETLVASCLVPNLQGLLRAEESRAVDEIAIFASASESFSQRNIACSIDESFERFRPVVERARSMSDGYHHQPFRIRGYVSCGVACPYEGPVAPVQVARVAARLAELGCEEISLGDTIGVGTPANVDLMLQEVLEALKGDPAVTVAVHYHDTYGQALANILVSLEKGITTIDSSVAGLGGCPYAKGATGNVATEDVVYMLNGLGVATGIDLDKLVDAAEFICEVLGQPSRSRAGTAIAAKRRSV